MIDAKEAKRLATAAQRIQEKKRASKELERLMQQAESKTLYQNALLEAIKRRAADGGTSVSYNTGSSYEEDWADYVNAVDWDFRRKLERLGYTVDFLIVDGNTTVTISW